MALADGAGLAALGAGYWLGVAAVPAGTVRPGAWAALFALCCAAAVPLWRSRWAPRDVTGWGLLALRCALGAAVLFGADFAGDALHGSGRAKADVAHSLGGLQLGFVLCPGATALALAGALRCRLLPPRAARAQLRGKPPSPAPPPR
jgi:hypothetical protein